MNRFLTPQFCILLAFLLPTGCIDTQDHGDRPDTGTSDDGGTGADTITPLEDGGLRADVTTETDAGVGEDTTAIDSGPGMDAGPIPTGGTVRILASAYVVEETGDLTVSATPFSRAGGAATSLATATVGDCSFYPDGNTGRIDDPGEKAVTAADWWEITMDGAPLEVTVTENGATATGTSPGTAATIRVTYREPGRPVTFAETQLMPAMEFAAPTIRASGPGFSGHSCTDCGTGWDGEIQVVGRAADQELDVLFHDSLFDSRALIRCEAHADSVTIASELLSRFERIASFSPHLRTRSRTTEAGMDWSFGSSVRYSISGIDAL